MTNREDESQMELKPFAYAHPNGAIWRLDNCPAGMEWDEGGWFALYRAVATPSQGERVAQDAALQAKLANEKRHTFAVPDGHYAVRDEDGRATGEVRPLPSPSPHIEGENDGGGRHPRQFLSTEDGEFNGNEPPNIDEINVDKIAKAIVLAACELDEMPDSDDDDTLLITVQDLEAVAHRHITAALERAALQEKEAGE